MKRTLRPLAILATTAVIGTAGTGCGSGASSGTGTTRGSGAAAGSNTAANTKLSARDKAVKFAECVRAHGVPHFPDPDAKGDFNFGADVTPAVLTRAVTACKDLQPPGSLSSKRTPTQQSAGLRFAQCVRDHGVKDFPDPVNGEPLINTYKIPSSNRPGGMTVLNAATRACDRILKASAGGQG